MQKKQIRFSHFLEYFPEIELPVHLGDSTHHLFSQKNEPLPPLAIQQYIVPLEDEVSAEEVALVEYVPCFRLPKTDAFHAIVYWKAGLLNYQYILATFEPKGEIIQSKVIAGTFSDGVSMTQSAATIEEDWMIYIVTGFSADAEETYDAGQSTAIDLELLPDGTIINAI
ncbi:MAG: hypothetical protein AAF847_14250 [Bacteroidota bacterium]